MRNLRVYLTKKTLILQRMSFKKEEGIGSITIKLHYCSREERDELIEYLEGKCWEISEISSFKNKDDERTESNKMQE